MVPVLVGLAIAGLPWREELNWEFGAGVGFFMALDQTLAPVLAAFHLADGNRDFPDGWAAMATATGLVDCAAVPARSYRRGKYTSGPISEM